MTPALEEHLKWVEGLFPDATRDNRAHIAALEQERDAATARLEMEVRQMKAVADALNDAATEMSTLRRERDAAVADNAAKDKAFAEYVTMYGVQHGDIPGTEIDCPEDDTCECPHVLALNAAFGADHPGEALLKEHRKALVRARNEGLRKAELHVMARPTWVAHDMRGLLAAEIDAMKEPEE